MIIVRVFLQALIVVLFLALLVAGIYSQKEGFNHPNFLVFVGGCALCALMFWVASLLGRPELQDKEWRDKYFSNGPVLVWARLIIVLLLVAKLVDVLLKQP